MEALQHRFVSRWLSAEARAVCEAGVLSDGCDCRGDELAQALLAAFKGPPRKEDSAVLTRAFAAAGVRENPLIIEIRLYSFVGSGAAMFVFPVISCITTQCKLHRCMCGVHASTEYTCLMHPCCVSFEAWVTNV